jgi:hypothetical protein
MNTHIARPRVVGLPNISVNTPEQIAKGALAKIPVKSRRTRSAAHEGDKAHDIVNKADIMNEPRVKFRRPYCSLNGAHNKGPLDIVSDTGVEVRG